MSSNIVEVIRTVLNFLFHFFMIRFHNNKKAQKLTNLLTANKNKKNRYEKHLRGKKLLICYSHFMLLFSYAFMLFVLFCAFFVFFFLHIFVLFCACEHLRGKKLLIRYLRFSLLLTYTFMLFVLFCAFLCF